MTRREHRNFIISVGGRLGFLEGIKRGGTGIGGLYIDPEINQWWTYPEFAQVSASPEIMKKVLMLRFNNTKRNLAMPIPFAEINSIVVREFFNQDAKNLELRIHIIQSDGPVVILENRGWNNKTVVNYFNKPPLKEFLKIEAGKTV